MKKIITLLFSLGAFTISFAQYDHQRNNDDKNYRTENKRDDQYAGSSNGDGYHDRDGRDRRQPDKGNNYSAKGRDFQVERINREFDFRIHTLQSDRYLRRRAKRAAIRDAEIERSRQIQMVNERFNNNHSRNRNR